MEQFRWGYNDVLKNRPNRPVYQTGGWWNNKLSFYFLPDVGYADINGRRSEILRDLKKVENPSELAGSYVLIDRKHFTGQNDLRIQHSYDDFGSFVLAPPQEWISIGNKFFVEIYEVPEQWSYTEPDGKALIREAFVQSAVDSDPMRFLYCLHPMYRQNLDQNAFYKLINTLRNMGDSERTAYLDEHLRYGETQGKWKVYFDSQ